MAKQKATKTLNPLHFEDLEPHRFEDLVRRLLYTFRDWTDIEPTGRAGSDEGFDVRAWEKGEIVTNDNGDGDEGRRTIEGRLWQAQGKREKTLSPAKIREIVQHDIHSTKPPYGYILAAATNISKAGYDAFREAVRAAGVKEYYFWGKDYLEDQLALPQNDEILFTFFGISLSPKRRTRISEIKFGINNKNRVLRLVFGSDMPQRHQEVPKGKTILLRDIKAEHYPYKGEYPDFEKKRRWEEHDVAWVTPRGVFFNARYRYAFYESDKKEWDFSLAVDLIARVHNLDRQNEIRTEKEGKSAERFWRHLPRRNQAKLKVFGFVSFENMLAIDDRGDTEFASPHIFIDFAERGPFEYTHANLVHRGEVVDADLATLKRVKVFPDSFPNVPKPKVIDLDSIGLSDAALKQFQYSQGPSALYLVGRRNRKLVDGAVIRIPKRDQNGYDRHVEVTYICETTAQTVLAEAPHVREQLTAAAADTIKDADVVIAYELSDVIFPFHDGGSVSYLGDRHDW